MTHFAGLPDEAFIRGDIPMTKAEIRILTLAKARIGGGDTVLDIGAGTGSLSVEAALLAADGVVYAIEKEAAGVRLIRANAARFGAANLTVIEGAAPDKMAGLPPCDAVLIGGGGRDLAAIIDRADELLKPGGRLVVNAVTVETVYTALRQLESRENYRCEAVAVQVTRLQKVAAYHMARALNPIHIIACVKGGTR